MRTLESLGISPAPWKDLGYGIVGFANRENAMIAVLTSKTNMSADARLIAAAPRMYKAAYDLLVKLHCIHVDCAESRELYDALAAASGEKVR